MAEESRRYTLIVPLAGPSDRFVSGGTRTAASQKKSVAIAIKTTPRFTQTLTLLFALLLTIWAINGELCWFLLGVKCCE